MNLSEKQTIKAVANICPTVVSIIALPKNKGAKSILGSKGSPLLLPNGKAKGMGVSGGSGFLVSSDGTIFTNRHIIENKEMDYWVVLQGGEKLSPKILAVDMTHDAAILKIDKDNLPFAPLGDSSLLKLGQTVIAIGNALGMFNNTVSKGIISGLSREIVAEKADNSQESSSLKGLIQTDAAINPGNSGGPLINSQGKVIGINAATVFGAENIGFALPINPAKRDWQEWKKYGHLKQPFLGVKYLNITPEIKNQFSLKTEKGALVISDPLYYDPKQKAVTAKSPAEKAGIKEGDIILSINNKEIDWTDSISDILENCHINQKIPFKIMRGCKTKILKVVLEEKNQV